MLNEGASSAGLDDDEDDLELRLQTDRKEDKSGDDVNHGSEKQLKNIGSSQVFDNNVVPG